MTRSPALERTTRYLGALVSRMRARGETRLPSYRELGHRAGVSTVTLWKGLRTLAASGLLRHESGKWFVAGTASAHAAERSRERSCHLPVWEHVRQGIVAGIEHGTYVAGSGLPGCKQLCERYGVAPATVRKALQALLASQTLQRRGRWYRVALPGTTTVGASVFLVAFGRGQIEMGTPRTRDNLRAVESLCARHSLRLRVVPFAPLPSDTGAQLEGLQGVLHEHGNAVGAIVWDIGLGESVLTSVVELLLGKGLPVAFVSESDTVAAPACNTSALQVFATGSSPADGAVVGRFLISRGYGRAAYVSPYGSARYSQRRRDGLIDAYERAGKYGAVSVFEEQRVVDSASLSAAARREIRSVYEHYGALEYAAFREMVRRRLDAPRLQGLFERAIADPEAHVWVCNNDTVAVEALRFLRRHDVAVPQATAVVGFDDSLEAFVERLSSYSFDPSGLAQATLNFLLTYNHRGRNRSRPTISLEGYVNERQTT